MKKTMRKIVSLVLIAAMLMGGSSMVFAEGDAPKVMLNGQYVEFPDAVPENVDGRIMVPFRPILEALGATVDWDQETKTVTATKGEDVIQFTIGGSEVAILNAGVASSSVMDVVPYVKDGRTYVGTRFMAEALDYSVGWDADAKTVIIIDFDEIFGNMEEEFSIMGLTAETDVSVMDTTFESQIDLELALEVAADLLGSPEDLQASLTAEIDALTKGMDADMAMALSLNIDQIVAILVGDTSELTEEELAELNAVLDSLKNIEMKIKMDSETGVMYIHCPLIAQLEEDPTMEDAWYKINLYEVYESMGVNFKEIVDFATSATPDMAVVADSLKASLSEDMNVETYAVVSGVYGAVKGIFGDEAFTKTTVNGVNTYTSEFNGDTIKDAFFASFDETMLRGILVEMDEASLEEIKGLLSGINGTFVVEEKNGVLVSSEMSFEMDIEGIQLGVHSKGDKETAEVTMLFNIPEVAMIELNMDATTKESTKAVDVTIPEGAQVVDLTDASMQEPLPEEAVEEIPVEVPAEVVE